MWNGLSLAIQSVVRICVLGAHPFQIGIRIAPRFICLDLIGCVWHSSTSKHVVVADCECKQFGPWEPDPFGCSGFAVISEQLWRPGESENKNFVSLWDELCKITMMTQMVLRMKIYLTRSSLHYYVSSVYLDSSICHLTSPKYGYFHTWPKLRLEPSHF